MELNAARDLAIHLMTKHGLIEKGWTFGFDNARKRLGVCVYAPKRISISRFMAPAATWDEVQQTMLHEIAHALVGHDAAHGPIWKAKAASIGYTGKRTAKNPAIEAAKAARAIDAPLEIGAYILSSGGDDAIVLELTPAKVTFRPIVGRRSGTYVAKPADVVVIRAADDMSRAEAARINNERYPISRPQTAPITPAGKFRLEVGATIRVNDRPNMTGVVTGFGNTRVKFTTPTGKGYTIPPRGLTVIAPATAETRNAIVTKQVEVLRQDQPVVITGSGRFGGRPAVIEKVNRTRYQLRMTDSGERITAPFEMVAAA
jgi:hypothetical protein